MHFLSPQACGPQYGYMCGQQQYISGVCANVSSSFQVLNSMAPAVQGRNASEVGLIRSGGRQGLAIVIYSSQQRCPRDPVVQLPHPSARREIRAFLLM